MQSLKWLSTGLSAALALSLLAMMILSYPAKSADAALVTSDGNTAPAHQAALLPTDSVIGGMPSSEPVGNADLLATDRVLSPESIALSPRQRVSAALEREDIRASLRDYGVSPEEAQARVASLTDSEVAELVNELDDMPAGAGRQRGGYVHDSTFPKLLVIGTAAVLFPPSLIFFGFMELLSYSSSGHSWDRER